MMTLEVRINGTLIGHVYLRRTQTDRLKNIAVYEYEVYSPGDGVIASGHLEHPYPDNAFRLTAKVLEIAGLDKET